MPKSLFYMAGQTRLELATHGVTGRYSNQSELLPLHIHPSKIQLFDNHVNIKLTKSNFFDPSKSRFNILNLFKFPSII